jgi:uncharacterized protein
MVRMGLKRWILAAAAVLIPLAGMQGCSTLDEKQREWIFQPTDRSWWGGAQAAEGMEDVWIDFTSAQTKQAVKLHALLARNPRANAPVLLYLHGARWNVVGSAHRMRRWQDMGFTVLGVDYRGFGQSSKDLPSETLALEDAKAAWDWLGRTFPSQGRFIYGHSLGGAIGVALAADVSDERGTIVEGSFSSLRDVVGSFKWGWLPVGPLLTQRFEADQRVASIGSPLLVVHGSADTLIKPELGKRLFDAAAQPKRFVLVEGGSHHNTSAVGAAQYREALAQMFGL